MCYLAAICCDPFSEHVGDVCLPLACSFPLLVCPVVLGTQGIKQQGFRLPVLRVAVPVSACTGVGWGTSSACSEHYVVATCMRVSLILADLLRADFFARPPALPVPWYSPGAAQWMCLFGKIWTSAPCRRRGVWHAAGRISAGDLSAVCRHSRSKGSCVCLRACSRPAKRDARVRALSGIHTIAPRV